MAAQEAAEAMTEINKTSIQPSSDERLWAALAHFSAVLFGWGLVAPLIIWTVQRGKSAYIRYQSLQALGYQVTMAAVWLLMGILLPILMFILIFVLLMIEEAAGTGSDELFSAFMPLIMFGAIFGAFGLYMALGIVGAIACLLGRNFHYPLLGGWLERYLASVPHGSGEGV